MNGSEKNKDGVRFNEHAACSICGHYGAFQIGHQHLCNNCYEGCGSCCPEFGREDLQELSKEDREEG